MTLIAIQQGVQLTDLDAWGSVTDLGSTLLEGDVKAYGRLTHGAPTDAVSSGYFGTTRGKFRMTYPFDEQAVIVTGEIQLTDESTGSTTRYKAGDTWFVTKGTPVLWEVLSESFVKHYLAVS